MYSLMEKLNQGAGEELKNNLYNSISSPSYFSPMPTEKPEPIMQRVKALPEKIISCYSLTS
jgi:hypothetical protein